MESEKWNLILIDWINCLELSKSVQNVNELKTGDFFVNLRRLITKSSDNSVDILTFIFDLLNKYYPLFIIENKTEIHLNDLNHSDLLAITSLLMHYTCIYDRRDVLISPLCNCLSKTTQHIIKDFLEKVDNKVTRESLNDIIQESISNNNQTTNAGNRWLNFESSSSGNSSPLQEFLKTPVSKFGRRQERDKIIKQLRADLEVERFEKADLQEELKDNNEKLKKYENQLSQKTIEISRLKSEIAALENRTPPRYQDEESRDLQKRLKMEIQSLEQYIEQIENEHEQTKKEKDTAKEQIRKLENETTIWQEKFFEIEKKFEFLSSESQIKEDKLKILQQHCEELEMMLDEYKTKPNDTLLYEDDSASLRNKTFDGIETREDLACSVIEVQLQDALRINDELKNKNDELELLRCQLTKDIEDFQEHLKTNQEETKKLSESFEKKLQILEENKRLVEEKLDNTEKTFEQTRQHLETLEKNLEISENTNKKLKISLEEIEIKFAESEKSKEIYLNNIQKMQESLEISEKLVQELETFKINLLEKVDCLSKESKEFSEQLYITREKLICSEEIIVQKEQYIAVLHTKYNNLNKYLTKSREELILLKNENIDIKKKFEELQNTMSALIVEFDGWLQKHKETVTELEENNKSLLEQLNQKTNICSHLEEELSAVKIDKDNLQTELNTCLADLENYERCLNNTQVKLEEIFKNYEMGRVQLEKFRSDIEQLESSWAHSASELAISLIKNEELENELKTLQSTYSNCQNELEENQSCLSSAREELTATQEELKFFRTHNSEMQDELSKLTYQLNEKLKELNDVRKNWYEDKNELEQIQVSYNEQSNEKLLLNEKLQSIIDENENLKNNLDESLKLKNELLNKIDEIEKINQNLQLNVEILEKENAQKQDLYEMHVKDLKEKLTSMSENNINITSKLQSLENEYENSQKLINSLKLENTTKTQQIQDQKVELQTIHTSVEYLKVETKNILEQLKEANNKVILLEDEYIKDREHNELLIKQNEELEMKYNDLNEQYKKLFDEKEILLKSHQNIGVVEIELNKKLEELQQNYELEIDSNKAKSIEIENMKKQCFNYESDIRRYQTIEASLKQQIIETSNELKEHNQQMASLLKDKEAQYESLMKQNEEYAIKIHSIEEQNILTQKNLTKTETELKLLRELLDEQTTKLLELEKVKLINIEKENAIKKLIQENYELDKQHKEAQSVITQLRTEVEQVLEKLLTVEEKCDTVQAENNTLNLKATNLETEKQTIIEQFKIEQKSLEDKCDNLSKEKNSLLGKLKHYEDQAANTRETMKNLEDTIQDYEITISGLKNVIDENLETLMSLKNDRSLLECETEAIKNELMDVKEKEQEQLDTILEVFKQNDMIDPNISSSIDTKILINECIEKLIADRKNDKNIIKILEDDIKVKMFYFEKYREFLEKLQGLNNHEKCDIPADINELEIIAENLYKNIEETFEARNAIKKDADKLMAEIQEIVAQKEQILNEKNNIESKNKELLQKLIEEKDKMENHKLVSIKQELPLISKENIPKSDGREDELKKKNLMLKQKLVLTENTKNNLEKRIKELREENKKLNEQVSKINDDNHYKKLLHDHIKLKEEYSKLEKELEQKNIEKQLTKQEDDKKLLQDLQNLREAYSNVMSNCSKLELENLTLKKMIDERNNDLSELSLVKEAYEKLLEENNHLMTECDTLKYKRQRDKEELLRILKQEKEQSHAREHKRTQEIRLEYERKLDKMKEKMVSLFKEEVKKEVQKHKSYGKNDNTAVNKRIMDLRESLFEAEQKIQLLEMERDMLKAKQENENTKFYLHEPDRASICSNSSSNIGGTKTTTTTTIIRNDNVTRRCSTLPRTLVEEVTVSRRTSINSIPSSIGREIHMEDEEDSFNNKYLADLKQGRCILSSEDQPDNKTRFSELAWRNSLVPAHLKSSYPAEMQFVSPSRFKDEDLKTGQIEFDNSLCKLLPGEKPRKKDFGTTSYKKPGPPTPSKNGGRLSLQGNEVHPLRETGDIKTPKRSTPNRIKALFTGKNTTRDTSETQSSTPKTRRLSNIFRRPK